MKTDNYYVALIPLLLALAACGGGGGGGGAGGGTPASTTDVARFAYVANNDKTISLFTVDAATGQLRHNGYVTNDAQVLSVAVDPFGRFAYAARLDGVAAFRIDASGALIDAGSSAAGTFPASIAVHPLGKFVYAANVDSGSISAYSINAATGALTRIDADPNTAGVQDFPAGTAPFSVTVDPAGKFVYAANFSSNDLSAYTINATTGALTRIDADPATAGIQNFAAGEGPRTVTVDPSGRFAYVANAGADTVSAYAINAATGALTQLDADPNTAGVQDFVAGTFPITVTVDPAGKFAYVANDISNDVSAYTINATTGALTRIDADPAAAGIQDFAAGTNTDFVAVDPSGKFAYAVNAGSNNVSIYGIDSSTGALTSLGTVRGRDTPFSFAMTKGTSAVYTPKFVYTADFGSNSLSAYTIDTATGVITAVANSPFAAGAAPVSVAVDPSGKFAYAANFGSSDISAYLIDPATGALLAAAGSPFATGATPASITVDPSGRFVYTANSDSDDVSAYTIDAASGALAAVGLQNVAAGTRPFSVTVDPTGRFAYVANSDAGSISAYEINSGTGALAPIDADPVAGGIQNFPAAAGVGAITVDPTGKFAYAVTPSSVLAYRIDSITGELTRIDADPGTPGIQGFPAGSQSRYVSVDPSGRFVYVANQGSGNVSAYRIDASSGALTRIDADPATAGIQSFAAGTGPTCVGVDRSGRFVYVTNGGSSNLSAYFIDQGSGALNAVGGGSLFSTGSAPFSVAITGAFQ